MPRVARGAICVAKGEGPTWHFLGRIPQCPLLYHMSGPVRKDGIKMLSLQNFSFIWKPMARGVFSLWELVRRADFENSARWCVVLELGAIGFPVVWGISGVLFL